MELADKEVKTAVRNMFKLLKKKQEQHEESMEDVFQKNQMERLEVRKLKWMNEDLYAGLLSTQ